MSSPCDIRTLFEIIDGAKDGNRPSYDECYFATLVLAGHVADAHNVLFWLEGGPGDRVIEDYRRSLRTDPKTYLGDNDPDNPEYQKWRREFKKVYDEAKQRA